MATEKKLFEITGRKVFRDISTPELQKDMLGGRFGARSPYWIRPPSVSLEVRPWCEGSRVCFASIPYPPSQRSLDSPKPPRKPPGATNAIPDLAELVPELVPEPN